MVRNLPANAGDTGDTNLILGLGRSPGGENCNLTLVFLPEKSHGQRSLAGHNLLGAIIHEVTKSQTQLIIRYVLGAEGTNIY